MSPFVSLPKHEIEPTVYKAVLCTPALLALGVQKLGSLPLQLAIVAFACADLAFHHFVEKSKNPDIHAKARKIEWLIYGSRLAVLAWSVGHLMQSLANWTSLFSLSAGPVLKVYSTYYRRHKFEHYTVRFADRWLMSIPIAAVAVAMCFSKKLKQWVMRDKLNLEDINRESFIHLKEPYLPLWTTALQLVTYVALIVFSKSRLISSALFALSAYTLYERLSHRMVWIKLHFQEQGVVFRCEEMFVVKNNAHVEVLQEIDRLREEKAAFMLFNNLQQGEGYVRLYVNKQPFSGTPPDQVVHKQHTFQYAPGLRRVEFSIIQDYEPGQAIQIHLDSERWVSKTEGFLSFKLEDGTRVFFPNVSPRQVLDKDMDGRTITAKILSKSCDGARQVQLICFSLNLPEWEEMSLEKNQHKYGNKLTIKCKGSIYSKPGEGRCSCCSQVSRVYHYKEMQELKLCRTCIETDFTSKAKNLHIVNFQTQATIHVERYTNRELSREVYYEARLEESSFSQSMQISVLAEINGAQKPVRISRIKRYLAGDMLQVPMGESRRLMRSLFDIFPNKNKDAEYDPIQKVLFAYLPNGMIVCFPGVLFPQVERFIGRGGGVSARVVRSDVDEEHGYLYLTCISSEFPPMYESIFSSLQDEYETKWLTFLEGTLKDLEAADVAQEIQSLERGGALYLFLQKIKSKKKPHELLEIARNANSVTVKEAHKKQRFLVHPDKHPENPNLAKILFQALEKACEIFREELLGEEET